MVFTTEQFKLIPTTLGGIYKITNTDAGKYYVGYSKGIRHRWYSHVRELTKNIHINTHLQNAWNQGNNFVFEVLEECSPEMLQEREHYWIDIFDCYNKDKGYNLYDNRKAKTWFNKISKKYREEAVYKDVIFVDKNNISDRKILSWNEYKKISNRNQFPSKNSFKDWFVFREEDDIDSMLPELIKKSIQGGYYRNKKSNTGGLRPTWVWNKKTRELIGTFKSMGEAAKFTNINAKRIHTNINKKAIHDFLFTSTGFIPEYYTGKTGPKPKSITFDGVEYSSYKDGAEKLGIKEQALRDKLKNKKPVEKTFKWILYKEDTEIPLLIKKDAINHIPNATKNGIKKFITGERPVYYGWKIRKITEIDAGVFNK